MTRGMCVLLAGCLLLTPWLMAQELQPAPKLSAAQIDDLIKQLGDGRFKVREKATKELEQVGLDALPQLRQAAKDTADNEVRRRLEDLMPAMERAAALSPTKITLNLKDKNARDAVKELTAASGYKIEVFDNGLGQTGKIINLELKDATFWDAIEKISEAGGIRLQDGWYGNNNATVAMQVGERYAGLVSNDGPFRITIKGFYYTKNVDFNTPPNNPQEINGRKSETLNVNIGVTVEPKLPLLGVGQPIITEATDDQDQSMVFPQGNPNNPGSYRYNGYSGYRSYMQQVQAPLKPSANGKKLKVLKGTFPVTVVSAQKPKIVVEKLLEVKNKTYSEGSAKIAIDDVAKNGNQVTIRMTISDSSGAAINNQPDYTWMNSLMQRLEVVDEKGNKYQSYGNSWNANGNSVQGTFTFGPNGQVGDPVKLIYYEWTTLSHSVPFEFKDVTLP